MSDRYFKVLDELRANDEAKQQHTEKDTFGYYFRNTELTPLEVLTVIKDVRPDIYAELLALTAQHIQAQMSGEDMPFNEKD